MPTVPRRYLTAEEYIKQERKSEYRSEYLDGEVFPMSGASHNLPLRSVCSTSANGSRSASTTTPQNSERLAINFSLYAIRFHFRALDPIYFPPGKASNIFRGAFGHIFRRLACVPQCENAKTCDWRETCPYARLFEPTAISGSGPSGLADWPRPFVLRATHLDGKAIAPGAMFFLDLNLFDMQQTTVSSLALTFAQLAREGLGPSRGRVKLISVCLLTESGEISSTVFAEGSIATEGSMSPLRLNLTPASEDEAGVRRLRIQFVTPTELKSGQQLAPRPEFSVLASRIRDRLSTLRELYGPGPLDLDFRQFGEQSKSVQLIDCNLNYVDLDRYSSRTGQNHSIGGFTGEAEYEGNLGLFLPFLYAAQWTGVGRQTVWGKGQINILNG